MTHTRINAGLDEEVIIIITPTLTRAEADNHQTMVAMTAMTTDHRTDLPIGRHGKTLTLEDEDVGVIHQAVMEVVMAEVLDMRLLTILMILEHPSCYTSST